MVSAQTDGINIHNYCIIVTFEFVANLFLTKKCKQIYSNRYGTSDVIIFRSKHTTTFMEHSVCVIAFLLSYSVFVFSFSFLFFRLCRARD